MKATFGAWFVGMVLLLALVSCAKPDDGQGAPCEEAEGNSGACSERPVSEFDIFSAGGSRGAGLILGGQVTPLPH